MYRKIQTNDFTRPFFDNIVGLANKETYFSILPPFNLSGSSNLAFTLDRLLKNDDTRLPLLEKDIVF